MRMPAYDHFVKIQVDLPLSTVLNIVSRFASCHANANLWSFRQNTGGSPFVMDRRVGRRSCGIPLRLTLHAPHKPHLFSCKTSATYEKSSNYPCILYDLAHNGEQLTSGQCCMKLTLEGHVYHCHFLCHYTKATAVHTLSLPHKEQMPWNHICLVFIKSIYASK